MMCNVSTAQRHVKIQTRIEDGNVGGERERWEDRCRVYKTGKRKERKRYKEERRCEKEGEGEREIER